MMRKHFKDQRTEEELRACYKASAGVFKSDQGISVMTAFMWQCGREITKVFRIQSLFIMYLLQVSMK